MKFLVSLAWKNLSRYKRRTVITMIAIAFGISMYIWIDGFLLGAEKDSERNLLWYETGVAKIMNSDYWKNIAYFPLKNSFKVSPQLIKTVEDRGFSWTSRTAFIAEMFDENGSLPVRVYGIDTKRDENVYKLKETIVKGEYLKPDEYGVLLGEWLAEDLSIKVGDVVTVRTRTRLGAYQAFDLVVKGILNCPNPQINKGTAFIPLDIVDREMEMDGRVTEVVLGLPEWASQESKLIPLTAQIEKLFPNLVVEDWKELAPDFIAISEGKRGGTSVLLFLIFIIAAVGISNTMLMAVYERIREIGMMRAMGMKDSSIRLAFLLEAGGIGFLGSLIGVALGAVFTFFMVKYGLDYSGILGRMDIGYRITGVFRSAWDFKSMILAFFFGVIVSMLVAFIPANRALKMEITDCLKYQ